ncbi:hypothetical protein M3Y94_00549600 [Aphelenchoides besseyi]|nr:hypothetical protein M3Y94_00549600 [Aphelenchoides besseyi]KAI6225661.1 hypothetical protein M3Y95_00720600 [Aphelenchoides besseyi]
MMETASGSVELEKTLKFRYIWPVKPTLRQLSSNSSDSTILSVSPKFSTVHDHVSFQWTLRIQASQNVEPDLEDLNDEDDEKKPKVVISKCNQQETDSKCVAISLYYVDGPVSCVQIQAQVQLGRGSNGSELHVIQDEAQFEVDRGQEVELVPVNLRIGEIVRISVTLELAASLFNTEAYLNAVSPTPFQSFLTCNYRARACSNVWKRKSRQSFKRPRSQSEGQPNCMKIDLERAFNRVMEHESLSSTDDVQETGRQREHIFKKLLVSCCDSCERRASIIPCADDVEDEDETVESSDTKEDGENPNEEAFECPEDDKTEIHDMLANMYFNKIALPQMEYVEDFADFLIDAELNDLPVLKRACERYLCSELNTKSGIITSLLLDMLFLSMVFQLPILKSMCLSELSERFDELDNVEELLKDEEYQKLDKRIRQISDRSLHDLVDECRRFREQRNRVQQID